MSLRGDVRLLYMVIVYFPFLDLYSLAYISLHLVHVIHSFDIYKDSSLSSLLNLLLLNLLQAELDGFAPMMDERLSKRWVEVGGRCGERERERGDGDKIDFFKKKN